mmetsp:Transcript_24710/g.21881  ORF Transcript_24710/g.21881 Transcript_24710/m.21881 type:complete len:106 (-) Transcript_24710:813-1130(-)
MLEHKRRVEFKPWTKDKIEGVQAKARDILLTREFPIHFIYEWFIEVIEPYINVEKIFFHQNITGKANSNYIFNLREFFRVSLPKFVLEIENKLLEIYNAKANVVV